LETLPVLKVQEPIGAELTTEKGLCSQGLSPAVGHVGEGSLRRGKEPALHFAVILESRLTLAFCSKLKEEICTCSVNVILLPFLQGSVTAIGKIASPRGEREEF
jgi:hypothetical protein